MTRPMIATITPQNWKKTSQVMYIGITSLFRGRQTRKDLHFLGNEEVNRHRVALLRVLKAPQIFYHITPILSSKIRKIRHHQNLQSVTSMCHLLPSNRSCRSRPRIRTQKRYPVTPMRRDPLLSTDNILSISYRFPFDHSIHKGVTVPSESYLTTTFT